ncbi:universal stress protein [Acidiferrimicrobium sp. IK]|uniref:universal stress protein n=1 Tax=Acidiferrimicrobium sp. IK TaxID=2871700 RepID=UPI0021CB3F04|nr:universal stress protein [Acidiferrimicrobium sp. IK]MCU4182871.1 universal stress protein [Acidiferrimicrobium sp. IK]
MAEEGPFITVGVDGSAASDEALRWAVRQAELTGARVKAVVAWQVPASVYGPVPVLGGYDYPGNAKRVLDAALDRVVGETARVEVVPVVVEGPPGKELLLAAEGGDLLVVGSRGHGAFAGMLLGSVSEQCVSHAHCPVVVVHHSQPGRRAG